MVAAVPGDFLRDYTGIADGYMVFVPETLMRFGKWEEILKEPEPAANLPLSRALWRFTRAVSLTALGRTEEAARERDAFRKAAASVPKDYVFGNNRASELLAIASNLLDGEMAAKSGRFEEAVKRLREAVRIEDGLVYNEPPDWIQPARHTLGAVLLRAGKPADAEAVYRQDLVRAPGKRLGAVWSRPRAPAPEEGRGGRGRRRPVPEAVGPGGRDARLHLLLPAGRLKERTRLDATTLDLFERSLRRCESRWDFLDRFYERFLDMSPEVREKFATTDLVRAEAGAPGVAPSSPSRRPERGARDRTPTSATSPPGTGPASSRSARTSTTSGSTPSSPR